MRKKRSTGETIRAPDGSGAVQTTGEGWVDSSMVEEGGGYFTGQAPGGGYADQGGDYPGGEEDGEEEINEVLAGAILNRPESIRLRSRSSRKDAAPVQVQDVFGSGSGNGGVGGGGYASGNEGGVYGDGEDAVVTFPSISNSMPVYVPTVPGRVKSPPVVVDDEEQTTPNGNGAAGPKKEFPLAERTVEEQH